MKIYQKDIDDTIIDKLVTLIKDKKELYFLNHDLVEKELEKYLKNNKRLVEKLSVLSANDKVKKTGDINSLIKNMRSLFYDNYTAFQTTQTPKREALLKELALKLKKKECALDTIKKLLDTHVSTKERLPYYKRFYEEIFAEIGEPKSIFEIGCGMNPISYALMGLDKVKYTATDLSFDEMEFLNDYFSLMKDTGLDGSALALDINKDDISKYKADALFAFKLLDLVDSKTAEKVLNANCRWLVISFSTKTISRRKMMQARRSGFQKMLRRLELDYVTRTVGDELIYFVRRG